MLQLVARQELVKSGFSRRLLGDGEENKAPYIMQVPKEGLASMRVFRVQFVINSFHEFLFLI